MKKIDNIIDLAIAKKIVSSHPDKRDQFLHCLELFNPEWSRGKVISQLKILFKIVSNNDVDIYGLYEEYIKRATTKRKIEIVSGSAGVKRFEDSMRNRQRPTNIVSHFTIEYWKSRGLSESDAIKKISELQSRISRKRTKQSRDAQHKKCKLSIQYWVDMGYTVEEAEILREPYLKRCRNDLASLVDKYGDEVGTKKYISRVKSYKESMIKNLPNRKINGYVSKESKRFFVQLYKRCRKLGITRSDICFGVSGSREFFIQDPNYNHNCGKFYDFTIKSLKLIVEYHGVYWHPRDISEWRNPNDYQLAIDADRYKKQIAIDFGMKYVVVWSDDDKHAAIQSLTELIEGLYNDRHRDSVL